MLILRKQGAENVFVLSVVLPELGTQSFQLKWFITFEGINVLSRFHHKLIRLECLLTFCPDGDATGQPVQCPKGKGFIPRKA